MPIAESTILHIVDQSVVETIDAFIRFRPGFHGDTGVRDYLYHRLMTNLPEQGTYQCLDGGGTLLVQAEWYTSLKYRKTGSASSSGRFDLGIPRPEDLELPSPRPIVTFECGRNKNAVQLVRDLEADKEHEGPQPADITKLAREITHKDLPYGYALEFYDENQAQATELTKRLREWGSKLPQSDRLRVVLLVCFGGQKPALSLSPDSWDRQVRTEFHAQLECVERRTCARKLFVGGRKSDTGSAHTNRVSRQSFLSSCQVEARTLIEAIEQALGPDIKAVFGGNTMTINRRPSGTLMRIEKAPNCISDLDPTVRYELGTLLNRSISARYAIDKTPQFRQAVVAALQQALVASQGSLSNSKMSLRSAGLTDHPGRPSS